MKLPLGALIFLISVSSGTFAQVIGKEFPSMTAETVDDKKIALPESVRGKYTLIGLAYSKKSESELKVETLYEEAK